MITKLKIILHEFNYMNGRLSNSSKQLPDEFDVEKFEYDSSGNITKYINFVNGYRWKAEYNSDNKQTYYENSNGYKRGK